MGDLGVIRLVAMDNIMKGRIGRARMEVKENLGEGGGAAAGGLSDPSTGFSLVQESSSLESAVQWKKPAHGQSSISCVLAHCPAEVVFAKIRLEQVRPDSAFWSSELSMEVTWKPRASMRAHVRGNDAGKMIVSARARALAACGSAGSTSIHSWPANGVVSNHARFARSVLRPRCVTADFR